MHPHFNSPRLVFKKKKHRGTAAAYTPICIIYWQAQARAHLRGEANADIQKDVAGPSAMRGRHGEMEEGTGGVREETTTCCPRAATTYLKALLQVPPSYPHRSIGLHMQPSMLKTKIVASASTCIDARWIKNNFAADAGIAGRQKGELLLFISKVGPTINSLHAAAKMRNQASVGMGCLEHRLSDACCGCPESGEAHSFLAADPD